MEILKQVELCRKPQVIVREGRSLPQKQTSWCLYCHQPLVFVAKIQNLEDPSTRVFAIPSSRATLNLLTPFSWYREPTMTKQLLSLFWRPALEIVNNNTTTITTATATTATTTATTTQKQQHNNYSNDNYNTTTTHHLQQKQQQQQGQE